MHTASIGCHNCIVPCSSWGSYELKTIIVRPFVHPTVKPIQIYLGSVIDQGKVGQIGAHRTKTQDRPILQWMDVSEGVSAACFIYSGGPFRCR